MLRKNSLRHILSPSPLIIQCLKIPLVQLRKIVAISNCQGSLYKSSCISLYGDFGGIQICVWGKISLGALCFRGSLLSTFSVSDFFLFFSINLRLGVEVGNGCEFLITLLNCFFTGFLFLGDSP